MKLSYCMAALVLLIALPAQASYHFSNFKGRPPIHVYGSSSKMPSGMTPAEIKRAYHLPLSGGKRSIVIVGAYDDPTIESDLAVFNKQFGLPACTSANGCFEKHKMSSKISSNSNWAQETS